MNSKALFFFFFFLLSDYGEDHGNAGCPSAACEGPFWSRLVHTEVLEVQSCGTTAAVSGNALKDAASHGWPTLMQAPVAHE